jgi:hypothetical protein
MAYCPCHAIVLVFSSVWSHFFFAEYVFLISPLFSNFIRLNVVLPAKHIMPKMIEVYSCGFLAAAAGG